MKNSAAAILLTLLVSLPLVPLAVAQADESQPYKLSDDAADVALSGFLPVPASAPSTPATDPVDILEAGIESEDELGLRIYLRMAKLNGDPTAASVFFGDFNQYGMSAKLGGTQVGYDLYWWLQMPSATGPKTGIEPVATRFCFRGPGDEGNGGGRFGCDRQNVEGTVDWDKNVLSAYVTKSALRGLDPLGGRPPAPLPPMLSADSQLTDIVFRAERGFPDMQDRLPDAGTAEPYNFRTDAANTKIRLAVDQGEAVVVEEDFFGSTSSQVQRNEFSVSPGQPGVVPIRVDNLAEGKRIINLTATFENPDDASSWKLQLTPSVQVPAQESRVVTLLVNATASTPHRGSAVVIVRGLSLAYGETAALRVRLVASVPPGPERPTLYFHAQTYEARDEFEKAFCGAFGCLSSSWLNTLQQDALATADGGVQMDREGFFDGASLSRTMDFQLDTPLTTSLLLDTKQQISATLAFTNAVEIPVEVELEISAGSGIIVASQSVQATIGASPTTVPMKLTPLADAARISAEDGGLEASLTVRAPAAGPGATVWADKFLFIPRSSSITFPFIVDPLAKVVRAGGSAFISINTVDDQEDFVNPGRAAAFNATLVNEGLEADEATLSVTLSDPTWTVSILPSDRFKLNSGDYVVAGILLHAPAGAKEGDRVVALVNVTSGRDPTSIASMAFTAIVTQAIDIPDEAAYKVDPDAQNKVVSDGPNDTPGVEAALLLVVALAAFAGVRRRRNGEGKP